MSSVLGIKFWIIINMYLFPVWAQTIYCINSANAHTWQPTWDIVAWLCVFCVSIARNYVYFYARLVDFIFACRRFVGRSSAALFAEHSFAVSSSVFCYFEFVSEVISYTAILLGLDLEMNGFCGTSSVEQMRTNENQIKKKTRYFILINPDVVWLQHNFCVRILLSLPLVLT